MILGFSDATIRIIKQGGGVAEQGLLCTHLGPEIAPVVYSQILDGYIMELLDQAPRRGMDELNLIQKRLEDMVWNRPARGNHEWTPWLQPLISWAKDSPWTLGAIRKFYPVQPVHGYCLIHGDPTLANLMIRKDGYLVISDPMPRLWYRKEIPERKEVDLGKILQSAIGWEYMLGVPLALNRNEQQVLDKLSHQERLGALLWASIHLARIAIRCVTDNKRPDIREWAKKMSKEMIQQFEAEY